MSSQPIKESKFKFRVVGVAQNGDQILLHKIANHNYWSLPGGKIEQQEPSIEALKREMCEELQIEVQVGKMIWIMENFYQKKHKFIHELALYFLMTFPANHEIYRKKEPFFGFEGDKQLTFQWISLNELDSIALYPLFLKKALPSLPVEIKHIIQHHINGIQE